MIMPTAPAAVASSPQLSASQRTILPFTMDLFKEFSSQKLHYTIFGLSYIAAKVTLNLKSIANSMFESTIGISLQFSYLIYPGDSLAPPVVFCASLAWMMGYIAFILKVFIETPYMEERFRTIRERMIG